MAVAYASGRRFLFGFLIFFYLDKVKRMRYYQIRNKEDVLKLISKDRPEIYERIVIQTDTLDSRQKAFYEKKLNDLYFACGCELGAACCVIALGGYVFYSLIFTSGYSFHWIFVKKGLVILILAGLTGKIAGLLFAKYRLKNIVKRLAGKV